MGLTKKRVAGVIAKCLLLLLRILVLDTTVTNILFLTHPVGGGITGTTNDIIYGSRQGPKVHENVAEPERLAGACRVAVCLSGHVRSFVHPIVHMSIRRNLVDAMREDGCEVDVFAYASSGDTVSSVKKHLNSEFTPDASDVDAALAYLAPVRVAWHQEQAGIIPNACPDEMNSHGNNTGAGNGGAWWEMYKFEASRNLFWQLYKSRAAYHMALDEETRRGGGFLYNWIIRARFDVAWVRPIPSVQRFPRDAVYFHSHYWPMSDQFALVPRALSDRFFSAVAAFYACDEVSWPPPVSWWQPDCHGMSFEESVLFRHIHAVGIPYRLFSMFEYVIVRGEGGGVCKLGTSDYIHTCNVLVGLSTGILLKPPLDRADCIITLAEWANLRCRALFSTGGAKDLRRVNAILDRNPASWENVIRNPFPSNTKQSSATEDRAKSTVSAHIIYPPTIEELDSIRSRMIALRDALLAPSSSGLNKNIAFRSGDSTGESWEERIKWDRWEGFETTPSWWIFSPSGCPITEYPGRAPHLVMYYTVGESLKREVAEALKCQINSLIGGDVHHSSCDSIRSIEEVTIDVALHTEELGVCTVDGRLGLSPDDHAQRFFRNPTTHCVGYGKLIEEIKQLPH